MTELRKFNYTVVTAFFLLYVLSATGHTRHAPLPAPAGDVAVGLGESCISAASITGVCVDWSDVEDDSLVKYSVQFECTDTTITVQFDIGTGDRLDGQPIDQSDLFVTFAEMDNAASLATDGAISNLSGFTCDAKAKALNPPSSDKPNKHQSNLFSASSLPFGPIPAH